MFSEIIGQDRAVRVLQNDISTGNLAGAYLFVGPPGVGKKMAAVSFAKTLNCRRGKRNSCNKCPSCRKIEKMSHPNLRMLSPQGESFRINQIRQLKSEIGYSLSEGKKRIWVMDEAEKLTLEAANSLLKILEEPPSSDIIILITHVSRLLPPTIISRCRVVHFLPLTSQHIQKLLKKLDDVPSHIISLVSELAQGSVSEALKLISEENIFEEREKIFELICEGEKALQEVFEISERWSHYQSSHLESMLNIFLFFLRDLLLLKSNISIPLLNQDKTEKLQDLKENYSFSQLYRGTEAVENTKFYLNANLSTQLVLEEMWLRFFYPEIKSR